MQYIKYLIYAKMEIPLNFSYPGVERVPLALRTIRTVKATVVEEAQAIPRE